MNDINFNNFVNQMLIDSIKSGKIDTGFVLSSVYYERLGIENRMYNKLVNIVDSHSLNRQPYKFVGA